MTSERAGYAAFVALALFIGWVIRRLEAPRVHSPSGRAGLALTTGALVGGLVGSKLMMVLYIPTDEWASLMMELLRFEFDGKTVIGGLTGGYLGVEIAKKLSGIRRSTGDAWAVAVPAAHAVGRLGCLWNGCCYGAEASIPWAFVREGIARHPAQVYEMGGNILLAVTLWALRRHTRTPGQLFRMYLVGYAGIRFACDPFRGDAHIPIGPLSLVQWYCIAVMVGFGFWIARDIRGAEPSPT